MQKILFAAVALLLATCTTSEMRTAGAGMALKEASQERATREAPPPPQLGRPARRGWGGNIYREGY